MSNKNIDNFVHNILSDPDFREGFVASHYSHAENAIISGFPDSLSELTINVLKNTGIHSFYQHQYQAVQACLEGKHIAISTGTASGKSLCFLAPIINSIVNDKNSCSIMLYPTKALCHDQKVQLTNYLDFLYNLSSVQIQCGVYDGDTVREERKRIRENGRIILSNPDMFNIGILPNHTEWSRVFSNLKYVIIDEVHTYRGIFGSHFTNLIRRFKRICHFYGSHPQFILCSATISNINEFSEKLIEEPVTIIDIDTSQKADRHFLVYNPPFVNKELGIRRSYIQESIRLLSYFKETGLQILFFARSRKVVEMVYTYLERKEENLENVRTYRGGYLASTRRITEQEMKKGNIQAVIATNALELGIDIGGIDIVILCGYPGTIAGTRQQSGRAGRRNKTALTIMITTSDPLEQYLANHPDYLFEKSPEQALIEPNNPYILLSHLSSAVFELPFKIDENYGDLSSEQLNFWLNLLQRMNKAKLSSNKYYWISEKYPAEDISMRVADPTQFVLINDGIIIGKIDKQSAFWMAHPGAVYLQEGNIYLVESLNIEKGQIILCLEDPGYYTEHMTKTEVEVIEIIKIENIASSTRFYGKLKVTNIITGFRKLHWVTREILDYGTLDLPPSTLLTTGYWFNISSDIIDDLKKENLWLEDVNKYGKEWENIRQKILIRDEFTCQSCGVSNPPRLEIHHKTPFKLYRNVNHANEFNNLISLCPSCHHEAEAMVKIQSGLSGLSYLLHNLAPLFLMCEKNDIGIHKESIAVFADQAPCILFYDSVPGGIGLSEKLFSHHIQLLKESKKINNECSCTDGCPSCTGAVAENGWGAKSIVKTIIEGLLK